MRLISASSQKVVFHLRKREKQLLVQVLGLYPRIPPAHQPLSKSSKLPDHDANQRLLNEALAEQRAESKKRLQTFLANPRRFVDDETGCRLSLSAAEPEWLRRWKSNC